MVFVFIVFVFFFGFFLVLGCVFFFKVHLLVFGESVRVVVLADQSSISWDDLTFLDDNLVTVSIGPAPPKVGAYNLSRYDFSGFDILLGAVTDHRCPQCNISPKTSNNVGSLFFLIPTHACIEHQNGDDDTKIDPIPQSGGKKNGEFHDYTTSTHTHLERDRIMITVENGTRKVGKKFEERWGYQQRHCDAEV